MAKQTITKIFDDLNGEEADESVSFALDGNLYEIDLTTQNAASLREFLSRFIESGTRVGRVGQAAQIKSYRNSASSNGQSVAATREQNQAIREWAAGQNFELSERGRIPQHIVDAYHQRHHARSKADALDKEIQAADVPAAKKTPRKRAAPAAQFAAAS